MISPPSELELTWQRVGIDPSALTLREDGTIACPQPELAPREVALPKLRGPSSTEEIAVDGLLGEGGMGMVFLGEQRSLAREVAVKVARPKAGAGVEAALLREARVTGALQHPGVVPVHMVGVDEWGHAMVVMKRLPSRTWAARLAGQPHRGSDLDRELAVLEQVANALAFAHERGVLHRDVKPDNVMLGDHGEVYLVDWGLAVRLPGCSIEDAPLAASVAQISGTLFYMAPEMAAGDGSRLCPATDVYLLAATLYEVVTGNPLHKPAAGADNTPRGVLYNIFCGTPPSLPADVPEPLRDLVTAALSSDPAARPVDGAAFRDALAAYRENRASEALAAQARQRLNAAAQITPESGDAARLGAWLAEARFGFEQALRGRPDDARLRADLNETLLRMIDHEVAEYRLVSAELLLREVQDPSAVVQARLGALREALREAQERTAALEAAAAESDLGPGARIRRQRGLGFGVSFLLLHFALGAAARAGLWTLTPVSYLSVTSVFAALFAVPALVNHRKVYPNLANRRFALTLGIMLLGQVVIFVGATVAGMDPPRALALSLLQLAVVIAVKTQLLDPRVFWICFVVLALGVAGLCWPAGVLELVGTAYAFYFIGGALLSFETTPAGEPGAYVLRHMGQFTPRARRWFRSKPRR